ncbi:DNA import protein CedB [Acidianus sp. HS-5]|uniref:DNA import protein CedB n=1 Tax=Acidianus sp. HS-5 TaxID=2886040 RepID=UPI001F22E34E|nr:DNA import protein CedB [Acidianus sp. HS-5]BDC19366.1 hypothetical protein HS5_22560 [Acidianus sp. HS-5]
MNEDKISFIFISVLVILLTIIYRNPLLLLLLLAIGLVAFKYSKINLKSLVYKIRIFNNSSDLSNIKIGEGYIQKGNEYIGILLINDIPVDYKDLSENSLRSSIASFYKILQIGEQVDIFFRKKYVDNIKYKEALLHKAQNLRIIIDSDPSNSKAKRELEIVNFLLDRISEGEYPFKYEIYLLIHSRNKERAIQLAEVISKGLEGLNIRSRLANRNEILSIIFLDECKSDKISIPSQVPFLTPFSVDKLPKFQLRNDGVLLGKDINHGIPVFWNIDSSENPHMLIIGPTGAGKTEFLINTSLQLALNYSIPIVFFDTKGDIKQRIIKRGFDVKIFNPLYHGISLLKSNNIPIQVRTMQIEKILTNSFDLDKVYSSIIFKLVYDVLEDYHSSKISYLNWDIIDEKAKSMLDEITYLYISKIIRIVKSLDHGDNIADLLVPGINIIDLTTIKNETLRKIIMYSVITDIYNKFSGSVDDGTRIVLVLDEAWTVLKNEKVDYPLVADLVKRGRGHGIALSMATQNIEDLGDMSSIYLDNIGLLIFMNNGDKEFWNNTVKRFVNINNNEINNNLAFLGRGEALIRFLGDPRPLLIKIEVVN